ncbi:MAG: exo-alpha-sialidase [Bacteroidota bacterium]
MRVRGVAFLYACNSGQSDRLDIPAVRLSGPSPFAGCAVGGPGLGYPNAEVETCVDANPLTIGTGRVNLIAVWQQDRWSNGGARGLVAGYSFDNGRTWDSTPLPFSACAGGLRFERASDPWVSFGPDGTAFAAGLLFSGPAAVARQRAIAAATSSDGGVTWRNVRIIKIDGERFFDDKGTVTADPARAGTAYVVWHRVDLADRTGPTWFAATEDGGRTWSEAQVIFDPGKGNQTIGNQIVIDPCTGVLYNFCNWIIRNCRDRNFGANAAFQCSLDGGRTWSAPRIIAEMRPVGVVDPNTDLPIRTGVAIPEPAIDPLRGTLYVVWEDARFSGGKFDEIALIESADGGKHWTEPARVNRPTGRPAFTPMVRVNYRGVVGVTYYDFRNLTTEVTTLPTDYWLAESADQGESFSREAHLAGPFDLLSAPLVSNGFFLGDYQGLVPVGASFTSVFVQANTGDKLNPTDVFAATVDPGDWRDS